MYILGISAFTHDTSAVLLKDGKLIAAIEEERLSRIKHSPHIFPEKSINFCLKAAGIKPADIDHVAYNFDHDIIIKNFWKFQPYFERLAYKKPWEFFGIIYMLKRYDSTVKKFAENAGAKLHCIEHHLAHAAGAYYGSRFKKANILTIDGRGEIISTLLAEGNGEIEKIKEIGTPSSIGFFYAGLTNFLGFKVADEEWKVMGLASYGKDIYKEQFNKIIWPTKDGFDSDSSYYAGHVTDIGKSYDVKYYTSKLSNLFGKPREKDENPLDGKYENIAASLQKKTEEIGNHLVDVLYEQTGNKNLCMSGGAALNSKMNGLLAIKDNVDDLYIQPQANDTGTALGAAYYVYYQLTGQRPEPLDHVYHGPEYNDEQIKAVLTKFKLKYKKSTDISGEVADLVAKNNIVGWFQGRLEIGPRALGNRSILANPANPKMKDLVNACVKGREWWRPFAVSMTYEAKNKYLKHKLNSPFMVLVDDVPEEHQAALSAGVHVDGTTRPQTVERHINPAYYDMIKKFGKNTGTPVILNTSFNLAGEPIVCTPEEAIKDFFGSGMDYLAVGNYLLKK